MSESRLRVPPWSRSTTLPLARRHSVTVEPRWKRSGDLYFRHGQRWYVTRVVTSPELRWDPPHEVFDADFIDTPGMSYDISSDGQRLLVVKRATSVSTNKVNLIVNWPEILRGNAGPH